MPGNLAPEHHTLTDWDFEHGATYRSLYAGKYVSPPTSLRFYGATAFWQTAVLCRIPETLVLPQGEVRTWSQRNTGQPIIAHFRNQAALGSANKLNCYYVILNPTHADVRRCVAGGDSSIGTIPFSTTVHVWYHFRVFWYNGMTPGEEPALCVDLYLEEDGEWVKKDGTKYDTLNYFADSEINRCGIGDISLGAHRHYYDDTEIWGPV